MFLSRCFLNWPVLTLPLLCLRLRQRETFEKVKDWCKELERNSRIEKILVGNKVDDASGQRAVSSEEAEKLAASIVSENQEREKDSPGTCVPSFEVY